MEQKKPRCYFLLSKLLARERVQNYENEVPREICGPGDPKGFLKGLIIATRYRKGFSSAYVDVSLLFWLDMMDDAVMMQVEDLISYGDTHQRVEQVVCECA